MTLTLTLTFLLIVHGGSCGGISDEVSVHRDRMTIGTPVIHSDGFYSLNLLKEFTQ